MRITAELSLYPLSDGPVPKIERFIGSLTEHDRIEIVVNQLSTQLRGEIDDVVACIKGAMQRSFSAGGSQVLVAKFLNADLPIASPPELGSSD